MEYGIRQITSPIRGRTLARTTLPPSLSLPFGPDLRHQDDALRQNFHHPVTVSVFNLIVLTIYLFNPATRSSTAGD